MGTAWAEWVSGARRFCWEPVSRARWACPSSVPWGMFPRKCSGCIHGLVGCALLLAHKSPIKGISLVRRILQLKL